MEADFERGKRHKREAEPRAVAAKTSDQVTTHQSEQIERTHGTTARADRTAGTNGTTRTEGPERPKRTPTKVVKQSFDQSGTAGGEIDSISIAIPPAFVFQEYEVPVIVQVRHGETENAQAIT